jgi:hypothetical protein
VHERQECVVPSHTGVVPAQSAAARQPTHAPVAVAHTGVAPTHAVLFVGEQAPQAPFAWQAGDTPPHSPSAAHARHACVPWSQMGVAPLQVEAVRQPTHVPVTALHTGVAPTQAETFLVEHAPHDPFA